jgi:MoaA/NifB/PqqE/SkfB family radical SAM enzyme
MYKVWSFGCSHSQGTELGVDNYVDVDEWMKEHQTLSKEQIRKSWGTLLDKLYSTTDLEQIGMQLTYSGQLAKLLSYQLENHSMKGSGADRTLHQLLKYQDQIDWDNDIVLVGFTYPYRFMYDETEADKNRNLNWLKPNATKDWKQVQELLIELGPTDFSWSAFNSGIYHLIKQRFPSVLLIDVASTNNVEQPGKFLQDIRYNDRTLADFSVHSNDIYPQGHYKEHAHFKLAKHICEKLNMPIKNLPKDTKLPSETFCVLPWTHFATNASGNIRPCCNTKPGINFIKDPVTGLPYKFGKADINDIWNSPDYVELRRALLNGERPEICSRCWREEDTGIESLREAWLHRWYDETKEYKEHAELDIRYADIRMGNMCNLKCRMCNPYASNQWLEEWELISDPLSKEEYKRLNGKSTWPWFRYQQFEDNIDALLPTIEEVYITGGEPTIIKEHEFILDKVIESGRASKVKIKYNTNLTNIPKHLIDKWKNFKAIKCNPSIDAVGDLARYIRYPSNWKKIEENFLRVRELDNVVCEIHCTVQMYNITRLHEFLSWAEPFGHKIYLNILNHPEVLNIKVLPKELKRTVEENLQPYLHIDRVQGIIDYMNKDDWSDRLPDFFEYSSKLDESRDQNLYSVLPEFERYKPGLISKVFKSFRSKNSLV